MPLQYQTQGSPKYAQKKVQSYIQKEQTQKFISIVLTLIALSIFGLFAINPTLSTIARLKKELADNERVDRQLQQKIANLSRLQEKYSTVQSDIPIVLSSLPKTSDIPLLIAQIQSVAKDSNIELTNIQTFATELFKKNTKPVQYYSYSFSISGSGNYQSISGFLDRVVAMQRIINIETFIVSRAGDKPGFLNFSLQGLAYYKEI